MTGDPKALRPCPIPGADPLTPHPGRRFWRGLGELAAFAGQALLALSELVRRRPDDTDPPPRRRRLHPVAKSAPFPIND